MDASCAQDASSPAASFWKHTYAQRASSLAAARPSTLASSDANTHTWEDEIAALCSLLAAAITQRNSCTKTCILPPELLSRVFEELAAISPIDDTAKTPSSRRGWLTIVHVCQHWRNVARAHSSLWQRITFTSVPLWKLFTESAGDNPLTVSGCVSSSLTLSERFLDLVPAQLHRMKELHVHAHTSVAPDDRAARLRFTALVGSLNSSRKVLNQLEVLSLNPVGHTGLTLRADFMKGHAPGLRRVTLQRIVLPPGINCPNLTSLTLIETPVKNPGILLKALQSLTCLESLTLDRTLGVSSITPIQPPAELSHIRRLVIRNTLYICTALLKSVTIHPLAFTEIDASASSHIHDEDLRELGNVLFSSEQFEPTAIEIIAYEGISMCDVVAWGDDGKGGCYGPADERHPTPSYPHPSPGVSARLPVPVPPIESPCSITPYIVSDFLTQVPKSTWEAITFKGHMHWEPEQVHTTFYTASNVDTLTIEDVPPDTATALCIALVGRRSTTGLPLFPDICTLHFKSVDFGCPADECTGTESPVHHLMDALVEHENRLGEWIELLTVEDCSISDMYVHSWQHHTQELDWDGETGNAHEPHTEDEGGADEDENEDEDGVFEMDRIGAAIDDLD